MRHRTLVALLAVLALSVWAQPAESQDGCIPYEPDPRLEPVDPTLSALTEADALIIQAEFLVRPPGSDSYRMMVVPWTYLSYSNQSWIACKHRDYHGQPSAGNLGSGVLVGHYRVLTAKHVMNNPAPIGMSCEGSGPRRAFVFGYGNFTDPWQMTCEGGQCWVTVPEADVYFCNGIHYSPTYDWAVVDLDRRVTGRNPLPIREQPYAPDPYTDITIVGHPNRIPMKVQHTEIPQGGGYTVRAHVLGGSSGSMAVDDTTGEVVGVLSTGGAFPLEGCQPDPVPAPCYREWFTNPSASATMVAAYLAGAYIP